MTSDRVALMLASKSLGLAGDDGPRNAKETPEQGFPSVSLSSID